MLALAGLSAQTPNPTQKPRVETPDSGQPIFRVTVVSRTVKAVNYHHRTGTTPIDFRGTELMPAARGDARVSSQMGSTKIETSLNHMTAANQFGPEYMTYVLWGITPEGRANNLGEVVLEGDHAKLLSTTDLQTFGLIVTAEPYFAVTQPSDVVVAENFIRNDTSGTIEQVEAKFELLKRGQYVRDRADYQPIKVNPKGPLQLAEAENAVEIARIAGARNTPRILSRRRRSTYRTPKASCTARAIARNLKRMRAKPLKWPKTLASLRSARSRPSSLPMNARQRPPAKPRRNNRRSRPSNRRLWNSSGVRRPRPIGKPPNRLKQMPIKREPRLIKRVCRPNRPPPRPNRKELPPMPLRPLP